MLVRWCTEQADREDRVCYLDSAPKPAKLYERHRFEVCGRVDVMVGE